MSLVYVLQEAPEVAIRKVLLSLCNEPGVSSKAMFNFLLQRILSTHLSISKMIRGRGSSLRLYHLELRAFKVLRVKHILQS